MLRVRDIMTPSVVTLSPHQSIRDAIETLVACHIGGAPVVDGGRVVGVLSAPDILEFESVTGPRGEGSEALPEPEASELSVVEPPSDDELASTYFTDMWPNEGPDVVGRIDSTRGPQWDLLADHSVGEVMSPAICFVASADEVSNAAQKMLADGVQRALVIEEESVVGIVTTTDILRAVAERRLTLQQFDFAE